MTHPDPAPQNTILKRLSTLWTAGIAYVALAAGAGLSIMYNVLQTKANRGPDLAWHDIVTAVAMPGLVVLMVELYVNRRWVGLPWYFQVMRVVGLGGIGLVAMRASWTHGHAWLVGHGQTPDVAITWPLAIDALAIMATALLLAGRRPVATGRKRGHGLKDLFTGGHDDLGEMATDNAALVARLATLEAELAMTTRGQHDLDEVATAPGNNDLDGHGHRPPWMDELSTYQRQSEPVATRPLGDLEAWEAGYEQAIDALGADLATETERFLAGGTHAPVVPGPTTTAKRSRVPDEARRLLLAWDPAELTSRDLDALLAAHFERAPRTIRAWRKEVLDYPLSPPTA